MGILDWADKNKMMAMGILQSLPMLTAKTRKNFDAAQQRANAGILGMYDVEQKDAEKVKRQEVIDEFKRTRNPEVLFGQPGLESVAASLMTQQSKNRPTSTRKDGVLVYTDTGEPVPGQEDITSPFKSEKEAMDMQMKITDSFNKQTAPDQKRVSSFDSATQVIRNRGGFDKLEGADDTLLMKAFANMLLPNEAVMSDDLRIIAQQGGIPAEFQNFMQRVGGGGQLKPEERSRIYQTMKDMLYTSMRSMENTKANLFPLVQQGQFDYNSVLPRANYPVAVDIPKGLLDTRPKRNGSPKKDPIKAKSIIDRWFNQ